MGRFPTTRQLFDWRTSVPVLLLLLATCNSGRTEAERLKSAEYPECGQLGEQVQRYLETGEPTEFDQQLAETRAQILERPEDARPGLIRANANEVIGNCDERLSAEAATEEARAAAEKAALAETEEQSRRESQFQEACRQRGGRAEIGSFFTCWIDYPGWPDERVALNDDGSFDEEEAELERENCEIRKQDADAAREEGRPWSEEPRYYPETGICTPGRR